MAQPVGTPGVSIEQKHVQPVQVVHIEGQTSQVGVDQTRALPTQSVVNTEIKVAPSVPLATVPETQSTPHLPDVPLTVKPSVIDFSGETAFPVGIREIAQIIEIINDGHMKINQPKPDLTNTLPVALQPPPAGLEPKPNQGTQ